MDSKLFHPSVDVLRVDGKDTKHLELAMLLLHDIGWLIQQCGIDGAVGRLREYYEAAPDSVILGCAHGAAALHGILGRQILDKETMDNLETYLRWKEECAQKGKTPADMVQFVRTMGQEDYADELESFMVKMEALTVSLS